MKTGYACYQIPCHDPQCPTHGGGNQPAQNTDKELWRKETGDYYSPSIHVTAGGGIGINVGGLVFVKPVEGWHALAKAECDRRKALPDWNDAP